MPKVSFIIPFYNSGATIEETVDSVLNQKYSDFDIWIVNDGSTDAKSLQKLEQLSVNAKITVLHCENNGPAIARNIAIKQCSAQVIVPLDADDKIKPLALKNALPQLLKNAVTGVVYGDIEFFGEKTGLKKQEPFDITKAMLYNQVAMCSFIKREVFEKSGYFDEQMSRPGLEDWEFWIRVNEDGWGMTYLPETFFDVRVQNNSRTFEVANKNIEFLKRHVHTKHLKVLQREYERFFYQNKMLKETPDYKIGNAVMKPYRIFKKLFKD